MTVWQQFQEVLEARSDRNTKQNLVLSLCVSNGLDVQWWKREIKQITEYLINKVTHP